MHKKKKKYKKMKNQYFYEKHPSVSNTAQVRKGINYQRTFLLNFY